MEINNRVVFLKLIDIFYEVILKCLREVQTTKDTCNLSLLTDASLSGFKFFQTAMTLNFLSKGTPLSTPSHTQEKKIDVVSIQALLRSQLEAFLTFHHMFFDTKCSSDEREYRYLRYKIESVVQILVLGNFASNPSREAIISNHDRKLYELKERITNNSFFKTLEGKEREELLKSIAEKKKSKNTRPRWREKAKSAGFSNSLGDYVYSFLSTSVHSEYISIANATLSDNDTDGIFYILNILVANMILELSSLFPDTKQIWQGQREVQDYIDLGRNSNITFSLGKE